MYKSSDFIGEVLCMVSPSVVLELRAAWRRTLIGKAFWQQFVRRLSVYRRIWTSYKSIPICRPAVQRSVPPSDQMTFLP